MKKRIRKKKSLKRRLMGDLTRSRDRFIYIALALALGFVAGMVILSYIGD